MTQQNYCLSDPTLPDNPITFASQAFLNMTGYNLNEILGKNCRFLQGEDTDEYAVYRIRLSIKEGADCHVVLLNYRKDGTPFYNRLFMTALRDTKGRVKNYLGVQCEVSEAVAKRINSEEKTKLENKLKATRVSNTQDMSEHEHDSSSRSFLGDRRNKKSSLRSTSGRTLMEDSTSGRSRRRQSGDSVEQPSLMSASSSSSAPLDELALLTEEEVYSLYNC